MPAKTRRTYNGEEAWFPLLEEFGHGQLRHAFIAAGVTPTVAGRLVFFLEDQIRLDRHQSESSRNRFRRVLKDLDPKEVANLASRPVPRQFNSVPARAA